MSYNNHRKCAKCGKTRAEDMSVSFHRFPNPGLTNLLKARAWAQYCLPSKTWDWESLSSLHLSSKVLCGRHFDNSQFFDSERKNLCRFAVPDVKILNDLHQEKENIFKENLEQLHENKQPMPRTPLASVEASITNTSSTVKGPTAIRYMQLEAWVSINMLFHHRGPWWRYKHTLKSRNTQMWAHVTDIYIGIARWKDIEQFYNLDKSNTNFVFAPALTDSHIRPNLKQQMRVKLAAQVFSFSVIAGILAKVATNELPPKAHATASFLKKIDQLFDAINADSPDLRRGKICDKHDRQKPPYNAF